MTDFLIDTTTNDYQFTSGGLEVVEDTSKLLAQRLRQKLKTFTNTLYTNIDYGVDSNLLTEIVDKSEFDQHIKGLILEVEGVESIVTFDSTLNPSKNYISNFTAITSEGASINVESSVGYNNTLSQEGLWYEGIINPWGVLEEDEILGE